MKIQLRQLSGQGNGFRLMLLALGLVLALSLAAVWTMEHQGHIVTGMDNQIVWGLPHVFAVFLVVAASGALNVASMASVFGKAEFKPLAPLSGVLAVALLLGGLVILLLDLGRPDRLLVALTHFNFRSIFAWNIFLYSGFVGLVVAYLWTQMERGVGQYTQAAGMAAFLWRMALTTGTGSIFGFLVARQAYDSALMAPLFVALSLSYGLAVFALVVLVTCRGAQRPLGTALLTRLARLQALFVVTGLYFVLVYHLTNAYFTKHDALERFILVDGGVYTLMFWLGQVGLGGILPLMLLYAKPANARRLASSAALVLVGAFAQMYVTIIGGQAFPLVLFPGKQVSSSFHDGVFNAYTPSLPEFMLGVGGLAVAGLALIVAMRLLRVFPDRLDDAVWPPQADTAVPAPSA